MTRGAVALGDIAHPCAAKLVYCPHTMGRAH